MWSPGRRIRAEEVRDVAHRSDSSVQPPPRNQFPAPPHQRLTITDSLQFMLSVKREFTGEHQSKYNELLQILGEFRRGSLDVAGVVSRVMVLLDGYPNLIRGFNVFLPQERQIEI